MNIEDKFLGKRPAQSSRVPELYKIVEAYHGGEVDLYP